MIYFYQNGFYTEPKENAVELSDEQHRQLMIAQTQGKQIIADGTGRPIAVEASPSQYHHWNHESQTWEINTQNQSALLSEQRQIMRDKINALRDIKIAGGVYIPSINKWIDTDAVAERNILSLKATFDLLGEQVKEIPWTFADNSVAMIDKDNLLIIWTVLMQAKTGNHANALKHKAAIEQSENPLEYDYSAGWTQTYVEFLADNPQTKEQTAT